MPPPMSTSKEAGHIWMVTGPAGCGKTTVATHLSQSLGLPYLEGDNFHPQSNIDKMSNGQPLNDADRWDWLIVLRRQALITLASHEHSENPPPPARHLHPDPQSVPKTAPGVVVTCSALKAKYRDVIRLASYNSSKVHVHFIYLKATEEVLSKRVASRQNHYMKGNMVHSQFMDLEEPTKEEWDCLTVDCTQSQADVMESTLHQVKHTIQEMVGDVHGAN